MSPFNLGLPQIAVSLDRGDCHPAKVKIST